ncbi:MAG: hypothetical protein ACI841_000268 [Planctomycetota bacterium]|jgi:hypothetical protein
MMTIACLATLSMAWTQDAPATDTNVRFADPIMVMAGDKPLTGMYPSPRLYDIDRDGQVELVIGDLIGRIEYAEKTAGEDLGAWGKLKAYETGERKLKFNNW